MFELFGEDGTFASLTNLDWSFVLLTAQRHGWEPGGTVLAPELSRYFHEKNEANAESNEVARTWDGGYFSNDLQWVTDADARELGAALERAIEQFPAGPSDPTPEPLLALPDEPPEHTLERYGEWRAAAIAWLGVSPAGKELLEAVARLCRPGGFTIG